jgi:ketosteroid isomerase-like protein
MFRLYSENRKSPTTLAFVGCLSLLSLTGCTQASPDTQEFEEKTLREVDAQWLKTVGAKDLDATVAFYTDDAVVMPADAPVANTKQAIREVWVPMVAPSASISWQLNQAEVARSGDLGYLRGVYQLVTRDAAGKATTEQGKFLEVWKRQAEGKWKCAVDSFSADAPPATLAPEKNK